METTIILEWLQLRTFHFSAQWYFVPISWGFQTTVLSYSLLFVQLATFRKMSFFVVFFSLVLKMQGFPCAGSKALEEFNFLGVSGHRQIDTFSHILIALMSTIKWSHLWLVLIRGKQAAFPLGWLAVYWQLSVRTKLNPDNKDINYNFMLAHVISYRCGQLRGLFSKTSGSTCWSMQFPGECPECYEKNAWRLPNSSEANKHPSNLLQ